MRVLITGIDGFTGSYLKDLLINNNYDVYGTTLKKTTPKNFNCDVRNFKQCNDIIHEVSPNIIIHLAAITHVAHQDSKEIFDINISGTKNILEAFKSLDVEFKQFIFASTSNVYKPQEGKLNEDSKILPMNEYAISKYACENLVNLYGKYFNTVVLRFFNYTGLKQRDNFLIPKIVSHFKMKSDYIELGDISVKRDFSDVRDIAKVYLELINKKEKDLTLNVCSGKAISIQDVINICERVTSHNIKIKTNPDFIRPNEIQTLCGDTESIEKFIPNEDRIQIEDTLSWMLTG